MFLIARIPDGDDLLDIDVAGDVILLEMKNIVFDAGYFAGDDGSATMDIQFFTEAGFEEILHS